MAFFVCTNLGFHTLESLGRPAVDSRLTSVVPLRFYGCDGSEEEGRWHENSAHSGCKHFFVFCKEFNEEVDFLVKGSAAKKL